MMMLAAMARQSVLRFGILKGARKHRRPFSLRPVNHCGRSVVPDVYPDTGADTLPDVRVDDMSDTRWLTYDELAEALGINPDSARRLGARKK